MKGNIIYDGAASGLVIEDNAQGVFTMNMIVGHEQVIPRLKTLNPQHDCRPQTGYHAVSCSTVVQKN